MYFSDRLLAAACHALSNRRQEEKKKGGQKNIDMAILRPAVSVVIPAYNSRPTLKMSIRRLLAQDYPAESFEVIIVDDGSTDGTGEAIEKLRLPPSFRYFRQNNKKQAAARNRGIRMARGEIILFIDADIFPSHGLIAAHAARHARSSGIFVEGRVAPHARNTGPWRGWKTLEILRERGSGDRMEFACITWNLSVRRENLLKVGLFDERFDTYGYEDFDLGYRLCRDAGLRLVYERKALARHANGDDLSASCRKAWESGKSFVRLVRLHPELLRQKKWPATRDRFFAWLRAANSFSPVTYREAREAFRGLDSLLRRFRSFQAGNNSRIVRAAYQRFISYAFFEGAYSALHNIPATGPLFLQKKFDPQHSLVFMKGT